MIKYGILWSKGPIRNLYSYKHTEHPARELEIINLIKNAKDIIFIRNGSSDLMNDLYYFSNNIDKLEKPIILITADGDKSVPSSYSKDTISKILNNSKIKSWYTQNYDRSIIHSKLKHLPIGLDLHTNQWLINNNIGQKIQFMMKCRKESPTYKRISNKIFSETHNSITHPERRLLYLKLKKNPHIIFSNRKSFIKITKDYNKYNFVLSPRGNGLDCHRTWELFLAGVIVITKTTPLDHMFIDNNLPVVILKEWDELNDDLPNKLNKWYRANIDKTSQANILPKMIFDYWIK